MLEYEIPNYKHLKINKVVLDLNGTLACDGEVIEGVKKRLDNLAKKCSIYILTADTFGTVQDIFNDIDLEMEIIKSDNS